MPVFAIIPSRYGSSRFEGKPLAVIAGKPMIQHVVERARESTAVDHVVVATDDLRIVEAVRGFGAEVVMTSNTLRSGTDRVAEAAERLGLAMTDLVVNVQGDQPLLDPRSIDDLVAPFFQDAPPPMTTLAFAIVREAEIHNPKDVKVVFDTNMNALYFSRAAIPFGRDLPSGAYDVYKHLGFYAYSRDFLELVRRLPTGRLEGIEALEQLRVIENGHRIRVVVTAFDSPEVDLPGDIDRINALVGGIQG